MASGRLLGTWVKTDTGTNTSHIPGTPCARGAARCHLVEISATPGTDAPRDVPFVVFRSDFTSSARTTVARQATKALRICGDTNENIVATLIPGAPSASPSSCRCWEQRGPGRCETGAVGSA